MIDPERKLFPDFLYYELLICIFDKVYLLVCLIYYCYYCNFQPITCARL